MAVLTGNKLFEYLDNLCNELDARKSEVGQDLFAHTLNSTMAKILRAEKDFLKDIHSRNGKSEPMLSFSLIGFPTIESLDADLEQICEMYGKDVSSAGAGPEMPFAGMNLVKEKNLNSIDWRMYSAVSKKDWDLKFFSRSGDSLKKKINFFVTDNGNSFQLSMAECYHADGIDKYSQTVPLLIRSGTADYKMAWNRMFFAETERYYVLNDAMVKSETNLVKSRRYLDKPKMKYHNNIDWYYNFDRKDYEGLSRNDDKSLDYGISDFLNYKVFMESGYAARLNKAYELIEVLERVYEGRLMISGPGEKPMSADQFMDALPELLKFTSLVNEHDPTRVYRVSSTAEPGFQGRHESNIGHAYQLILPNILSQSDLQIGTLSFVPPYAQYVNWGRSSEYRFTKGWVSVKIDSSTIETEKEYNKIYKSLVKMGLLSG